MNTVNNIFFSDTDVIMVSCPDSTENNKRSSAPAVFESNAKYTDTGSTVQTSINTEKFIFFL